MRMEHISHRTRPKRPSQHSLARLEATSEALEAAPSRKVTSFIMIWPCSVLNRKVPTRHFFLDASDAVPCRRRLLGDRWQTLRDARRS
jgi:hypothetical protein